MFLDMRQDNLERRGRDDSDRGRSNRRRRSRSDKRTRRSRSKSTSRCDFDRKRKRRRRSRSRSGSRGGGYGVPLRSSVTSTQSPRLYGSGRHAQAESDDQNSQHTQDLITREDEDWNDYQDDLEEDMVKQVEKIRQRRREILEKHKKQEPSERLENAEFGVSESGGDVQLSSNENVYTGFGHNLLQNGLPNRPPGITGLDEGIPKSEIDFIFGESPTIVQNLVKCDGLILETNETSDNWDDAEGYYCHHIGELVDGRFEVAGLHGRGVFSSVVRARTLKPFTKSGMEVAIKIMRNNDVMRKSGQQELSILKMLDGADPDRKRHCVRLLTSLVYRNHLCLVFESMHTNLREALKKFGWKTGVSLDAVRVYAKQLFIALKHLRNCGVLHCDIKPDNILVNEAQNVLKLCDFGSAMFKENSEITPYLVSRFYRAPEIILGLPYDHSLDMWSVGCCLYEIFTGKVLFPGSTNNDMLRLHMELKGPCPKKMLKKACFVSEHFDQDYNFCVVKEDAVTKASIKRVLEIVKPKGIDSFVTGQRKWDENEKMFKNFKDLLDKILMLDPGKRLTVSQALKHPFITGT